MIHEIGSLQLTEEREKWEMERQEKEKELVDLRHHLEEQLKEKDEDMKALEKRVTSMKGDMDRLEISHPQEIKDLTVKHQQQVAVAHCKVILLLHLVL